MRELIGKRIAELESELERFVREVERQIAAYHGAIGELKRLLEGVDHETDGAAGDRVAGAGDHPGAG